ncbi:SRPBCC domain-containing protein [Asaia sp. As-1742]|uniref:SRPBCC domain-containing protein n=1 Tax=Asaia sp. As-1742 TaxID=2608325 RepID=UPI001F044D3A|nr:SRPBCC domain-containing protein [Asaia sp. As-1742]
MTPYPVMNAILWPEGYLPGQADNFVSNECIVADVPLLRVWALLTHPDEWPRYYANSANPRIHNGDGPQLSAGCHFAFETFGFPVEAHVTEYVAPEHGRPGRLAWHGWAGEKGTETRLDVHHAWLVEMLTGNRLRVLTQETQNGATAKALATTRPNPMLNGHQDWLDGLIRQAQASF